LLHTAIRVVACMWTLLHFLVEYHACAVFAFSRADNFALHYSNTFFAAPPCFFAAFRDAPFILTALLPGALYTYDILPLAHIPAVRACYVAGTLTFFKGLFLLRRFTNIAHCLHATPAPSW